ncbi:aspartate kinase [Arthrobacter sp. CAN_A214]
MMKIPRAAPPRNLIVQKYGGSSLADAAGIRRSAQRIAETQASGYQVLAVVSAMGDTTDELLDLATSVSPRPRACDLDALLTTGELVSMALLVIALADLGANARTFTGSQAGLITDSLHGKARITDVKPDRIHACLKRGDIAIVAGFQGRTRKKKALTTLGRGGSDLTAVALAAALHASVCEIYTDVDGIYTADPRVVPTARKIEVLSSEEMLEFAASGAKILHLRCVEYARRFNVPIHVRSSFIQAPGTLVLPCLDGHRATSARERVVVSAVTSNNSAATITVTDVPLSTEATARIFGSLANSGFTIRMITRYTHQAHHSTSDLVFALPATDAPAALATLTAIQEATGFRGVKVQDHMGQITVSGLGMRSSSEVLCAFFRVLSDADIPVQLIETSELSISAVIPADRLEDAVRGLEVGFGLNKTQIPPSGGQKRSTISETGAAHGPAHA